MKKLVILLFPLLTSCAYFATKYDPNEYKLITEISLDANRYKSQCSNPTAEVNAVNITYKTELLERYTQDLPNNDEVYKASIELNDIAKGLESRYHEPTAVPKIFCELKYSSIENAALLLKHVIGNKPR